MKYNDARDTGDINCVGRLAGDGRILLAPICVQAGGNIDRTLETFAGAESRREMREGANN